jgi:hypothetical protein
MMWSGLALTALVALGGCSSGRIWLDHQSTDGATLHWYTREATIGDAQARAATHCSQFGKRAQLLDEFEDEDVTTAHFGCQA